ncbi:DNA-binding response regulator [Thauera humireducens]|uniref:response regulator transcription factor n=1 Tax=Thauera humireducens TaxID=1134435 RepID=UPI002467A800|nr:response regulator transcription factor [Thauera humireducens]CAH1747771.1 DNA-binding response regulator [Thauera humireducens]
MHVLADTRILTLEDDLVLGTHLKAALESCGSHVTLADDGGRGFELACEPNYDLILLDLMLPGMGGLEVLHRLRGTGRRTPVIVMSALGDEAHRIRGFDTGADDYLPKPFSMAELRVRIEAILRRVAYERSEPAPAPDDTLAFDDAISDLRADGRAIGLTPTEYRLLKLLYRHAGEALSKPLLYRQVLHKGYSRYDRSLDMHVSNIRRKLARQEGVGLSLEAVWGKGYLLRRGEA